MLWNFNDAALRVSHGLRPRLLAGDNYSNALNQATKEVAGKDMQPGRRGPYIIVHHSYPTTDTREHFSPVTDPL